MGHADGLEDGNSKQVIWIGSGGVWCKAEAASGKARSCLRKVINYYDHVI